MICRGLAIALLALIALPGCVLDFDQFRDHLGSRDGTVPVDASLDAGFVDRPTLDAPARPDVPTTDAATPTDRPPSRCTPTEATIRVAHMAAGLGPVDLCMRRSGAATYLPVRFNGWPESGVAYGTVSAHVPLNSPVMPPNDRWQFALVPHGADCSTTAVATQTVTVDPLTQSTLLFTSEVTTDGRLFGLLGLLSDQVCTTCPAIDVRAVHASFAASSERIDLSINYNLPPSSPESFVNVFFATNVSYGQTAPVGGAGFDCDTAWLAAANLPQTYTVQFAALNVSGDILARSSRVALKSDLLLRSHMATLFFLGGDGGRTGPPEFVICYEGAREAGMTTCDRIPASAPEHQSSDAGAATLVGDGGAGADAAVDDDVLL